MKKKKLSDSVPLSLVLSIQSGHKFLILAKDFKFDLMLFLDVDTRMC